MVNCDKKGCGKLAKYNIQKLYHLYEVFHDKDGCTRYEELKTWDCEEDNDHFCAKHANEELDLGVDEDD